MTLVPDRVLLAGLLVLCLGGAGVWSSVLRIGDFSEQSPDQARPDGWTEIRFGDNESSTEYDLVRRDSSVVVRARSENGASGLMTRRKIDLDEYPILEWRWRVDESPEGGDLRRDTTADAPARLYVTFNYDGLGLVDRLKLTVLRRVAFSEAPSRALNYVWTPRRDSGAVLPSPFTDQIQILPLRSGDAKTGRWVRERRNVAADYREVFGEDPPPVNGVAIMTDTDNTGDRARAYYGDIVFRAAPARPGAEAPSDRR